MATCSRYPLLLDVAQLQSNLDDPNLLIIDLGSIDNHLRFHIPGAIHLPYEYLVSNRPPAPGLLPADDILEDAFSHIAYLPEKHIVAYDDMGGLQASRFLWTLDLIGHRRMSLLNGGLHAWLDAQAPVEQTMHKPIPTEFTLPQFQPVIADKAFILQHLNDPELQLWDSRSAEEYQGHKIMAQQAGHIPGAVNLNWQLLIDQQNSMQLRPQAELESMVNALGLDKSKSVITYCQTHRRSALTYFVLKLLGYSNIKGYAGSWSEWGNCDDTPTEL